MKKFLLISRDTDAAKLLEEAAKKNDLETVITSPESIYIVDSIVDGKQTQEFYAKDKKLEAADLCMIRDGTFNMFVKKSLEEVFKNHDVRVVNTFQAIENCRHKYLTQILLNAMGIKTPVTAFISHIDQLKPAVELLGDKFPKIIKTVTGSHGIGVIKVDSMSSMKSVLQVLLKTYDEIIIQEFLEHTEDYRILTIGYKPVAYMKRMIPETDFRSNVEHQENREEGLQSYEPSEAEKELAVKMARGLGVEISAIDYVLVDGEVIVFEVNTSPGLNGIQSVTKDIDIADLMIKYMLDPMPASECADGSVDEVINLEGSTPISIPIEVSAYHNEPFNAKIDTGAQKSWISAQDVKVEGSTVSFMINGKQFTAPLQRLANIRFAGGTHIHKDMPIIKLDVGYKGQTIQDVDFIIYERNSKYPMLLGRDLLSKLSMSIKFPKVEAPAEVPPAVEEPKPEEVSGPESSEAEETVDEVKDDKPWGVLPMDLPPTQ